MYYYIYIPGLGDKESIEWQKKAVKKWNTGSREAVLIDAQWYNHSETYLQKYQRVLSETEAYIKIKNGKFCVVGASAGGSMAINIFETLRMDGAVTIAGKLLTPETIGPSYHASAPALRESVTSSQEFIHLLTGSRKKSILTISPLIDEVVSKNDMKITGSKNVTLKIPGHVFAIGYMLLFGKNKIFKWFERLEAA